MTKVQIVSSSHAEICQKGKSPEIIEIDQVPAGFIPQALLNLAARAPLSFDKPVNCDALWSHLLEHQKVGVQRIVHQFKGRCLLADEMGLGKTLQAVAVILHFNVPTLVVCPAFLKTEWHRTLEKWNASATVCTYDKISHVSAFDLVIVDEAHYIKSRESRRSQTIIPLILSASYALLMSGTPCPNRPEELFNLLHSLRPNLVPDFVSFATRYCNPRRTRFSSFDTRGCDRKLELAWLLNRAFQIRRTKAHVLPNMPDKIQQVLHVAACDKVSSELATLKTQMSKALQKGSLLSQSLIMDMYRATCRAKMNNAVQLAKSLLNGPTLIFAHHQIMLKAMIEALPNFRVGRIDGSMTVVKRQEVVDALQSNRLDVVVLSMAAAGVGLTLTNAITAVFLEIPWNPGTLLQCEDRIHRIGQTKKCAIYYILAQNTLDLYVWRTIHRKQNVCTSLGL